MPFTTPVGTFGALSMRNEPAIRHPPVAEFEADEVSGTAPLTVEFTDLSTYVPSSWLWDFGDGSDPSTAQHPTHEYEEAGEYTVSLTVTNNGGEDAETKTDYITVTEP